MVLAFAGDSTITSFLGPGTSPLPSVAHHTQSRTDSARTATAPHPGGPARECASMGIPANDPTTVTETTRLSASHAVRCVRLPVATAPATSHGTPPIAPDAASAAASAAR